MGGRKMGERNAWQGGPAQVGKLKVATDVQQRTNHQGSGGKNRRGWSYGVVQPDWNGVTQNQRTGIQN